MSPQKSPLARFLGAIQRFRPSKANSFPGRTLGGSTRLFSTPMAELTERELLVIRVYFETCGFSAHRILDIRLYLQRLSFHYAEQVIDSLIEKNVLSKSPDGLSGSSPSLAG